MPIIFFMLLFFYVASLNEVHKLIINFSQVISQYAVTPCAAFSLMKIILSVINEKSCFYSIFFGYLSVTKLAHCINIYAAARSTE